MIANGPLFCFLIIVFLNQIPVGPRAVEGIYTVTLILTSLTTTVSLTLIPLTSFILYIYTFALRSI